jgi:hypothetical protein
VLVLVLVLAGPAAAALQDAPGAAPHGARGGGEHVGMGDACLGIEWRPTQTQCDSAHTQHPPCASCPQEAEETKEEKLAREREEREAEQRSEFDQIQVARKLLPMFPYR